MHRAEELACVVFAAQLPLVAAYAAGWIPIHPIVFMLPLIGVLDGKMEGRGKQGLGLRIEKPMRSLYLATLFAGLSFADWLIALGLEGISLEASRFGMDLGRSLATSFLIGVFILATFEKAVCRGYIQTRPQEARRFKRVVLTSLLFAALHLRSAFLDHRGDLSRALLRFFKAA